MITEQQQELASLHALGALEDGEARAFEAEMRGNAELHAMVAELQRASDLMDLASPQVPLPGSLREKVMARITAGDVPRKPMMSLPIAALAGLRFDESPQSRGWKQLPIPGASIRLLSFEKERGYAVLLGKLEPGTRYPEHVNAGPEDFFILTGDLVVSGRKLVAGDFHHADGGSVHEENYSVEGCTLLAVLTANDPLVAFAMA